MRRAFNVLAAAACGAVVVACGLFRGHVNSSPNLRWCLFSHFGADKMCPEMLKRGAPLSLVPGGNTLGRFFPTSCRTIVVLPQPGAAMKTKAEDHEAGRRRQGGPSGDVPDGRLLQGRWRRWRTRDRARTCSLPQTPARRCQAAASRSSSALSAAPTSTAALDSQVHIMRPTTAPSEP